MLYTNLRLHYINELRINGRTLTVAQYINGKSLALARQYTGVVR